MLISVMKSKIHRAVVTGTELDYEGSLSLDKSLMDKAVVFPHEKVQIVNVNNGQRFETYVIEANSGSGEVCLNGPAARLGQKGDLIIIISYCYLEPEQANRHKPVIIKVDSENRFLE